MKRSKLKISIGALQTVSTDTDVGLWLVWGLSRCTLLQTHTAPRVFLGRDCLLAAMHICFLLNRVKLCSFRRQLTTRRRRLRRGKRKKRATCRRKPRRRTEYRNKGELCVFPVLLCQLIELNFFLFIYIYIYIKKIKTALNNLWVAEQAKTAASCLGMQPFPSSTKQTISISTTSINSSTEKCCFKMSEAQRLCSVNGHFDLLDTYGFVGHREYTMTHLSTLRSANNPPPSCERRYTPVPLCTFSHASIMRQRCWLWLAVTSQLPSRKPSIICAQIGWILMQLFWKQLPKIAAVSSVLS